MTWTRGAVFHCGASMDGWQNDRRDARRYKLRMINFAVTARYRTVQKWEAAQASWKGDFLKQFPVKSTMAFVATEKWAAENNSNDVTAAENNVVHFKRIKFLRGIFFFCFTYCVLLNKPLLRAHAWKMKDLKNVTVWSTLDFRSILIKTIKKYWILPFSSASLSVCLSVCLLYSPSSSLSSLQC